MTRVRRSWDITERQRSVLAAIRAHIADHGEAPTVREIAAAVGLASPSSVLYQLRRLEEAGAVRRARGTGSRDYRLS
ncbi:MULTISPECIES: winged helix-turn-helix transcriptional regulator [unclassified Streptomyces]|uniref:LexA family protein n=1 Tax=unclassified Streptomyces TaxID=2593676 RepID=UPI0022500E84|nr:MULTISPECIES: MarR family transcriptional regulator [unclassified Streptomyces]MCX5439945.1 MarR family transcriptional regulator [Streptomyces sp. NBC_00063]WSE17474.1 MarR family transcriptional regulator [Streptomyces sp. NBC_01397]WUB93635.1 MarR family transcriptional regulator [Streptomyces sp. NBC_00569]